MVKSLMRLHDWILQECEIRCGTDTHRDRITLARRTKHEGDSFLTISLPNFGSDFERSLDRGMVGSDVFLGFKRTAALPRFLSGLLSQVFDPIGGKLLEHPDHEAILAIRQFCLMSKKVLVPCTDSRRRVAFDQFGQVEKELADHFSSVSDHLIDEFGRVADVIWSGGLADLQRKVENLSLIPRHGPGATAEKIRGNSKYRLKKWHTRLEPFFPLDQFGLTSPDLTLQKDTLDEIELVEPGIEQPVRVISVPKTLRTPRIIAIEPVCMQYTQQAIAGELVRAIQQYSLTSGHVNFRDQGVNRELALDASQSQRFATVDLSEASDRVHADLVYRMLASVPTLRDAIFACRSTRASLEDGRTYQLTKFASMGSALCFPIESMVFYTLCILNGLQKRNLQPTPRNIKSVAKSVYVYGDDLIVPSDEVLFLSNTLGLFGLKVNAKKTFDTGKFRESCGMDAYDGTDVTPVYFRRMFPGKKQHVPEFVSAVSFANQLYLKGWWTTAKRVRDSIELLVGPMPHVQETSPCLGWISASRSYSVQSWDRELQAPIVKGFVLQTRKEDDRLFGYPALMKYFLRVVESEDDYLFSSQDDWRDVLYAPMISSEHLDRVVRSGGARINRRWARPY